jgi:hypoxanthine phosphoribosyltransferase
MAEDAFGYVDLEQQGTLKSRWDISKRKNILIVDDINDTGATFNWIKQDWQSSCLPNEDAWKTVWGKNVRFATLTENLSSEFDDTVNYTCHEVNKAEEDVWLVYPWENVGTYA